MKGKTRFKKGVRMSPYRAKEFDKDLVLASYFGFIPVKTPHITKEDESGLRLIKDPYHELGYTLKKFPFGADLLEKIAILRTYNEWNLTNEPQPVLLAYRKPLSGSAHKKSIDYSLGLEILGLSGSSAEAILIRTILSILREEGFENLSVHINSLGDKDSVGDYERMIGGYVRKNIQNMSPETRKNVKRDIFEVVRCKEVGQEKVCEDAPRSLSFLSENSRIHFKEVLEFVESFDIPYTIAPALIASPGFCSHTIFEIGKENEKGEREILASGFWYSRLTKKLGFKKELPAIGATLSFKKKNKGPIAKSLPRPKFYLIQLGFQAKMKALQVVDILREAKVSVAHSLAKDKLQSQLGSAENMKVPYVMILGQKEAIENSVVIRDMSTRVQETILIKDLANYTKKLK